MPELNAWQMCRGTLSGKAQDVIDGVYGDAAGHCRVCTIKWKIETVRCTDVVVSRPMMMMRSVLSGGGGGSGARC